MGISGYSGIRGASGYSGISGYQGIQGISGYSGRSGFSGYSGTSGRVGSTVLKYYANDTPNEEIIVVANAAGITATISVGSIEFIIPNGVIILSAALRIIGDNLSGQSINIDTGQGATSQAERYQPNVQAWREDTGSMIPISVTLSGSNYDLFSVNNLVRGGVINLVKLSF
jgi:hypothetical protein